MNHRKAWGVRLSTILGLLPSNKNRCAMRVARRFSSFQTEPESEVKTKPCERQEISRESRRNVNGKLFRNSAMDLKNVKKLLQSSLHFNPDPKSQADENQSQSYLSAELKGEFTKICANFLGGGWNTVEADKLIVKHIKGGLSNMLFLCELPENGDRKFGPVDTPDRKDDPHGVKDCRKTLLRIYFNPEIETRLVSESVIFTLLSEKRIGPKLYGVFNDGRLEEFIVSNTLQTADIWQPEMSVRIAKKLAALHNLNLPISKSPTYLIEALDRWFARLKRLHPDLSIIAGREIKRKMTLKDLFDEFLLLKEAISHSDSPVVFCHNDLQEGNILSPTENSRDPYDLIVIDFEYASYNYRAFDFANHFCEWTFDYTKDSPPFFHVWPEKFPDAGQQENFFRAYLAETGSGWTPDRLRAMAVETESFVPVSHFLWTVWALLQREVSPISFGFAEYAQERLSSYFDSRSHLMRLLGDSNNNHSDAKI